MDRLSEEEKKAIELLKILSKTKPYIIWGDNNVPYNKANKINTILNLLEKQQKELEKKDKTMIKMARVIKSGGRLYGVRSSQGVIEYFTKQVEGE